MGFLKKIFSKLGGRSEPSPGSHATAANAASGAAQAPNKAAADDEQAFSAHVEELTKIFATYFAPNKSFYATPGSPAFEAYFGAINKAQDEMLTHVGLFAQATGWAPTQLAEIIMHPRPGVSSMLICGLIFKMGAFAVVKSAVYCVDFSEMIPNCVALYLLLIARQMPEERRKMTLDVGEGTDPQPLNDAITALKILDPNWACTIH